MLDKSKTLDIPCPKCGHQAPETLSRLESSPQLTCSNCGAIFDFGGEELKRALADAESKLAEFKRKIENDFK